MYVGPETGKKQGLLANSTGETQHTKAPKCLDPTNIPPGMEKKKEVNEIGKKPKVEEHRRGGVRPARETEIQSNSKPGNC